MPDRLIHSPEIMICNFDFTITKAAYYKDSETGEYIFISHKKFFEHLITKKLVLDDKILFPLSTFNRILRYTRKGYFLLNGFLQIGLVGFS